VPYPSPATISPCALSTLHPLRVTLCATSQFASNRFLILGRHWGQRFQPEFVAVSSRMGCGSSSALPDSPKDAAPPPQNAIALRAANKDAGSSGRAPAPASASSSKPSPPNHGRQKSSASRRKASTDERYDIIKVRELGSFLTSHSSEWQSFADGNGIVHSALFYILCVASLSFLSPQVLGEGASCKVVAAKDRKTGVSSRHKL
jgi:hypothetical protein